MSYGEREYRVTFRERDKEYRVERLNGWTSYPVSQKYSSEGEVYYDIEEIVPERAPVFKSLDEACKFKADAVRWEKEFTAKLNRDRELDSWRYVSCAPDEGLLTKMFKLVFFGKKYV